MSGGYYGYAYFRIQELIILNHKTDATRSAIQTLTLLMANLLKEVEWVDSGDSSPGDEEEALNKLLGFSDLILNLKSNDAFNLNKVRAIRSEFLNKFQIEDLDSKPNDHQD